MTSVLHQNMAGHGGLISGEVTPLQEDEEPMDGDFLPVPVDMEDRHAYDGVGGRPNYTRMGRILKFRPPSFVSAGVGWSPNSQRKVLNSNSASSNQLISEHRYMRAKSMCYLKILGVAINISEKCVLSCTILLCHHEVPTFSSKGP